MPLADGAAGLGLPPRASNAAPVSRHYLLPPTWPAKSPVHSYRLPKRVQGIWGENMGESRCVS